jgi:chemotaxis protein MotA
MAEKPVRRARRPDLATFAGLVLALVGVLGGLILENGQLKDITQFTAALIVVGGTVGALLVSNPGPVVRSALRRSRMAFLPDPIDCRATLDEIIRLAALARRNGIVSLEDEAVKLTDPFLQKGLNLAVDGVDTTELRSILDLEIRLYADRADRDAKVFESAGGYAPTIGIIGAVMGLIQVMKHLENITEVGKGIAVAFVATIYGVGLSNLLLLPVACKIRAFAAAEIERRELILEGLISISEGMNPKLIREKLSVYQEGVQPGRDSGPVAVPQAKAVGTRS